MNSIISGAAAVAMLVAGSAAVEAATITFDGVASSANPIVTAVSSEGF
jgi:hypothetical protein